MVLQQSQRFTRQRTTDTPSVGVDISSERPFPGQKQQTESTRGRPIRATTENRTSTLALPRRNHTSDGRKTCCCCYLHLQNCRLSCSYDCCCYANHDEEGGGGCFWFQSTTCVSCPKLHGLCRLLFHATQDTAFYTPLLITHVIHTDWGVRNCF